MPTPVLLYVEDDTASATTFKLALRESGCDADFFAVENGETALAFMRRQRPFESAPSPGIVVIDLILPGKTGLELIEDIRQLENCAVIPIVVLTGWENPSIHERARELGAREVFLKSMNLSGWCESAEKICGMFTNAS